MPNTQLTLIQIDNYGPWTTTPRPRPEADIQSLQGRLFADVAQLLRAGGGYPFHLRFDNMVALTNGLDRAAHRRLQESVGNRHPVTVSLGVGVDASPVEALTIATENLQAAGSAQDPNREEVLRGEPLPAGARVEDDVEMAHFDVVDATRTLTDELAAYHAYRQVMQAFLTLADHLHERHEALTFYMGGDNMVAVSPHLPPAAYEAATEHVETETGLALQVGVGRGATAYGAGIDAKRALEACREHGSRVETRSAGVGGPRADG